MSTAIKNILSKPEHSYKPWALWLWNLTVSKAEMVTQLNSFIDKGFCGAAIRPSRDMSPAYLSEEFFALFEECLHIAEKKGFFLRLADDLSVSWNTTITQNIQKEPELGAQVLTLVSSEMLLNAKVFERTFSDPENTIVLITRVVNQKLVASHIKRHTVTAAKPTFSWKAPAGEWQVMVFEKRRAVDPTGVIFPDIFNPECAQLYTTQILEEFTKRFNKFIPKTFAGFITEMPSYGPSDNSIPWNDDVAVKFKTKYKKDMVLLVPSLFFDTDTDMVKNRNQIYDFVRQSAFERFAAPIENWAKKRRLSQWLLTAERSISRTSNQLRNTMSLPVGNFGAVGIQNQEGYHENIAMLRAIADQNVCENHCETVTVIGRNRQGASATLQSLKHEIDCSLIAGTSHVLVDGFFFNLDHRSYLKTPTNPFWYSSEWNGMQRLTDYTARLNNVCADLKYVRNAVVLMPTAAILAEYTPGNDSAAVRGLSVLSKTIAELQRLNIDFDLLSEDYIASCSVFTNGEFATADRKRKGAYQAIIVPYGRFISRQTFAFLEKLASRKGCIVFIDQEPLGTVDDGITPSFAGRVEKLCRSKGGGVSVLPLHEIAQAIGHIDVPVKAFVNGKKNPDILVNYGVHGEIGVSLVVNMSDKQEHQVALDFTGEKFLYHVNCSTGEMSEVHGYEHTEQKSSYTMFVAQQQVCVLLSSAKKMVVAPVVPAVKSKKEIVKIAGDFFQRNYRIVLKDQWQFSPSSLNILPLPVWTTRIGLSRDSGGYSHLYESYFEVKDAPRTTQMVFLGTPLSATGPERDFEVNVNGNPVKLFQAETTPPVVLPAHEEEYKLEQKLAATTLITKNAATFDLKNFVRKGVNRISLRSSALCVDPWAIHYPPMIVGNFSVFRSAKGWVIDAVAPVVGYDSWTNHGYPYLCGVGTYKETFEVPAEYNRLLLKFSKVSGSLWVSVNGTDLGMYTWQPLEIDITKLCTGKRNEVEVRICNTVDTIIKMTSQPSGLLGEAYIDVY